MGCCQTAIPKGLRYYRVWFDKNLSRSKGPCSYAVLVDSSNFTFSTSYVTASSELRDRQVPVVLDWAVTRDDCSIAPTKPGYACVGDNSECVAAANEGGYICKCKQGFKGNPYDLHNGCKGKNPPHIYRIVNFSSLPSGTVQIA